MFTLFNLIIAVVLGFIDGILGWTSTEIGLGVLGGIYSLAVLLPGLAVGVRRLHDIGKSGWNYFLAFIPLVGGIAEKACDVVGDVGGAIIEAPGKAVSWGADKLAEIGDSILGIF